MSRSFALFARNQEEFTSRVMKNLLAAHELDEEIHTGPQQQAAQNAQPTGAPKRPQSAASSTAKRRGRSASRTKPSPNENSKQQLGSREDLAAEVMDLKKKTLGLEEHITMLRSENHRLEIEVTRQQRHIDQLLTMSEGMKGASSTNAQHLRKEIEKSILVRQLKAQLNLLRDTIADKDQEIELFKRDIKSTHLKELSAEKDEYLIEITRLHKVVEELRHELVKEKQKTSLQTKLAGDAGEDLRKELQRLAAGYQNILTNLSHKATTTNTGNITNTNTGNIPQRPATATGIRSSTPRQAVDDTVTPPAVSGGSSKTRRPQSAHGRVNTSTAPAFGSSTPGVAGPPPTPTTNHTMTSRSAGGHRGHRPLPVSTTGNITGNITGREEVEEGEGEEDVIGLLEEGALLHTPTLSSNILFSSPVLLSTSPHIISSPNNTNTMISSTTHHPYHTVEESLHPHHHTGITNTGITTTDITGISNTGITSTGMSSTGITGNSIQPIPAYHPSTLHPGLPPGLPPVLPQSAPVVFSVQDRILCQYRGKGKYYPGVLAAMETPTPPVTGPVTGSGPGPALTCHVRYDDGDEEHHVPLGRLKKLPDPGSDMYPTNMSNNMSNNVRSPPPGVPPGPASPGNLPVPLPVPLPLYQPGQPVDALYYTGKTWYPGVVKGVQYVDSKMSYVYDVLYADGDREKMVLEGNLRLPVSVMSTGNNTGNNTGKDTGNNTGKDTGNGNGNTGNTNTGSGTNGNGNSGTGMATGTSGTGIPNGTSTVTGSSTGMVTGSTHPGQALDIPQTLHTAHTVHTAEGEEYGEEYGEESGGEGEYREDTAGSQDTYTNIPVTNIPVTPYQQQQHHQQQLPVSPYQPQLPVSSQPPIEATIEATRLYGIGEEIEGNYEGNGVWYPGTVIMVHHHTAGTVSVRSSVREDVRGSVRDVREDVQEGLLMSYDVQYEDGDIEQHVTSASLRPRPSPISLTTTLNTALNSSPDTQINISPDTHLDTQPTTTTGMVTGTTTGIVTGTTTTVTAPLYTLQQPVEGFFQGIAWYPAIIQQVYSSTTTGSSIPYSSNSTSSSNSSTVCYDLLYEDGDRESRVTEGNIRVRVVVDSTTAGNSATSGNSGTSRDMTGGAEHSVNTNEIPVEQSGNTAINTAETTINGTKTTINSAETTINTGKTAENITKTSENTAKTTEPTAVTTVVVADSSSSTGTTNGNTGTTSGTTGTSGSANGTTNGNTGSASGTTNGTTTSGGGKYVVGQSILAYYTDTDAWYTGHILTVHPINKPISQPTVQPSVQPSVQSVQPSSLSVQSVQSVKTVYEYDVVYEDGDRATHLPEHHIRAQPTKPTTKPISSSGGSGGMVPTYPIGSTIEGYFPEYDAWYKGTILSWDTGNGSGNTGNGNGNTGNGNTGNGTNGNGTNGNGNTGNGNGNGEDTIITTYAIRYDDGDEEGKVPETRIRKFEKFSSDQPVHFRFSVNDRIEGKYHGGGEWYTGIIKRCHRSEDYGAVYSVEYTDGDWEEALRECYIRPADAATSANTAGTVAGAPTSTTTVANTSTTVANAQSTVAYAATTPAYAATTVADAPATVAYAPTPLTATAATTAAPPSALPSSTPTAVTGVVSKKPPTVNSTPTHITTTKLEDFLDCVSSEDSDDGVDFTTIGKLDAEPLTTLMTLSDKDTGMTQIVMKQQQVEEDVGQSAVSSARRTGAGGGGASVVSKNSGNTEEEYYADEDFDA